MTALGASGARLAGFSDTCRPAKRAQLRCSSDLSLGGSAGHPTVRQRRLAGWHQCGERAQPRLVNPARLEISRAAASSAIDAEHHHHHHHEHGHSHSHGHDHEHEHYPDNFLSRFFKHVGILRVVMAIEHSSTCALASIGAFTASLLIQALSSTLPPGWGPAAHTVCISTVYALSGLPQVVQALCIAASGTLNTHVLMALAAFGTLYLGLPQEGALLLLLFQLSHILEEKFTAKAEVSLERLFSAVPQQAMLVSVDDSGAPLLSTARQSLARQVAIGQHVLVKAGESVPLDGVVVWGTANVSLQHISGESAPVRMAVGAEVPAGSVSMDGVLVVRVTTGSEDSTPARIARMAAEAQANKPRLSRLLERVGGIWSKAVIGATLATLVGLLALGVPLMEPGGAVYRAMGVLTAGSPCAVVLVPLAYVCAIATITRKGVLVKSGAALDNLMTVDTVALDKTGTITSGTLTLTEARVLTFNSSSNSNGTPSARSPDVHVLPLRHMPSTSSVESIDLSSDEGPAQDGQQGDGLNGSEPYRGPAQQFGEDALRYAVALSRASNHPVSRAMLAYALSDQAQGSSPSSPVPAGRAALATVEEEVKVSHVKQVPGAGVEGVCQQGCDPPVLVRFGSLDFVTSSLPAGSPQVEQLQRASVDAEQGPASALSAVVVTHVPPGYLLPSAGHSSNGNGNGNGVSYNGKSSSSSSSSSSSNGSSADTAAASSSRTAGVKVARHTQPDQALGNRAKSIDGHTAQALAQSAPQAHDVIQASHFKLQALVKHVEKRVGRVTRVHSRDGTSVLYKFERGGIPLQVAADASGKALQGAASAAQPHSHVTSPSAVSTSTTSSPATTASHPAPPAHQPVAPQQPVTTSKQEGAAQLAAPHVALLCFEDVIQPGTRRSVRALQQGAWRRGEAGGRGHTQDQKNVVMLTGDNDRVARRVAGLVGIQSFKASMRPEDKLGYVQAYKSQGQGPGGLLMMGDGINDAPALAAARVGVAVASTPSDLVAGAADIIVLNGQGVANLPWLFAVARKTHVVVQQNLALALAAVAAATVPTVAGFFPLWLAVLLHEGSTLLVALNSLRLLLDPGTRTLPAALAGAGATMRDLFSSQGSAHSHDHHHHDHHDHGQHDHHHDHDHHHEEKDEQKRHQQVLEAGNGQSLTNAAGNGNGVGAHTAQRNGVDQEHVEQARESVSASKQT